MDCNQVLSDLQWERDQLRRAIAAMERLAKVRHWRGEGASGRAKGTRRRYSRVAEAGAKRSSRRTMSIG